ncbi:glutathione S-transferase family protein [Entomobacter blattae]|uniref:Dichloromethane dehalogenase n=1 Tax=Entomobacter blattae TaxID=2762277 RepID=A0A7H1NUW9_9PROT|nr:glutathione S-transferase family protein [Entomobacter blattae]QNT79579.1 Dichloromethane dehalogenase [Entomobacter blattae]
MRILYHIPLSPACRKIRLILAEKRLPFELMTEKVWEKREEFLKFNPVGTVPVLVEENGLAIPESYAISEYLEEAYPDTSLLGRTLGERVEVRRLVSWMEGVFSQEVTDKLLGEKYMKRFLRKGNPDGTAIRQGYTALYFYLEYLGWLAEMRIWLAGSFFSQADLTAAAYLSSLDFIGDIDWSRIPAVKEWYARVKCRPCFRSLLQDRISGITPPIHYADLDF